MDEYFMWTLEVARTQGGGLEGIFRRYDTSGGGTLDIREFSLAVEDSIRWEANSGLPRILLSG